MSAYRRHVYGFTIAELLVVIVVIGILAAITVAAYNGIQNRAADIAIQSDLSNMNKSIVVNSGTSNTYPYNEATLSVVGLKASKGSYGSHLVDTSSGYKYNSLYCSTIASYSPSNFAIIAGSKSGKIFSIKDGEVKEFPVGSWTGGWGTICPAILGVSAGNSAAGVWMYENSIWKVWLGS